ALAPKGEVVDAYQAWCGPCKMVVDLFRKIRNEVSSDLLHFAAAEVDSIDALEEYRGKCEPIFLFYTVSEKFLTAVTYQEVGNHRPWRCSKLWGCGTEGCGQWVGWAGVGLGGPRGLFQP
uniref:Thioredoxin domain-containing protein n=1 Tax=Gallus gallus TaxID=9031 RepID=A0A8V0ZXR7_CHICK